MSDFYIFLLLVPPANLLSFVACKHSPRESNNWTAPVRGSFFEAGVSGYRIKVVLVAYQIFELRKKSTSSSLSRIRAMQLHGPIVRRFAPPDRPQSVQYAGKPAGSPDA
jgi:hypothetical protein